MRNCVFLADDESLVTSGGRDCAVLLWAFEARADAEGAGMSKAGGSSSGYASEKTGGARKGNGHSGAAARDIFADDPEVETIVMAEEDRSRHPDLRDLSR